MVKVKEKRSFEVCVDNMKQFEMEILNSYLNQNYTNMRYNIERRYNLTTLTNSKKSQMDSSINVLEIVFICNTYYNFINDLCEIEIIEFL